MTDKNWGYKTYLNGFCNPTLYIQNSGKEISKIKKKWVSSYTPELQKRRGCIEPYIIIEVNNMLLTFVQ
jgi:hypothetical protein